MMFDGLDDQIKLPALCSPEDLPNFLMDIQSPGDAELLGEGVDTENRAGEGRWQQEQEQSGSEEVRVEEGLNAEEHEGGSLWRCAQHRLSFTSRRALRDHKKERSCKGKRTGGERAGKDF